MKRTTQKLCMMVALFALFILTPISVYAEDNLLDAEDILGSSSDLSGYILPDATHSIDTYQIVVPDPEIGGTTYHELFAIYASHVNNLLTSKISGKSFTRNQLPTDAKYIRFRGALHHSLEHEISTPEMRGGICYYNPRSDQYVKVAYATARLNENGLVSGELLINGNLKYNQTYYSFIKNVYPAGYVSGDLTVYYTKS